MEGASRVFRVRNMRVSAVIGRVEVTTESFRRVATKGAMDAEVTAIAVPVPTDRALRASRDRMLGRIPLPSSVVTVAPLEETARGTAEAVKSRPQ